MRYLRGHMGGDEVIVVAGRERTAGHEREMKEVADAWLDGPRFDLEVSGTPASFLGEFILVEAGALPQPGSGMPRTDCARLAEIHREVAARNGSSPETFYAGTYRRVRAFHYRTRFLFWPPPRVEHFACGSGSTALALRLALGSPDAPGDGELEYRFEVECEPPGRLGETRVCLAWNGGALRTAHFTHDRVEILGAGAIRLDPVETCEERGR